MVFGKQSGVAVYASHDDGASWSRATHGKNRDRVFEGIDPAVEEIACHKIECLRNQHSRRCRIQEELLDFGA
jgi:hypothetical protein